MSNIRKNIISHAKSHGLDIHDGGRDLYIKTSDRHVKMNPELINDLDAYHSEEEETASYTIVNLILKSLSHHDMSIWSRVKVYPKNKTRNIVELFKCIPTYGG